MCILKQKMFIDVIINITPKTHDTERQTKYRHLRFELKNLIFVYFYKRFKGDYNSVKMVRTIQLY